MTVQTLKQALELVEKNDASVYSIRPSDFVKAEGSEEKLTKFSAQDVEAIIASIKAGNNTHLTNIIYDEEFDRDNMRFENQKGDEGLMSFTGLKYDNSLPAEFKTETKIELDEQADESEDQQLVRHTAAVDNVIQNADTKVEGVNAITLRQLQTVLDRNAAHQNKSNLWLYSLKQNFKSMFMAPLHYLINGLTLLAEGLMWSSNKLVENEPTDYKTSEGSVPLLASTKERDGYSLGIKWRKANVGAVTGVAQVLSTALTYAAQALAAILYVAALPFIATASIVAYPINVLWNHVSLTRDVARLDKQVGADGEFEKLPEVKEEADKSEKSGEQPKNNALDKLGKGADAGNSDLLKSADELAAQQQQQQQQDNQPPQQQQQQLQGNQEGYSAPGMGGGQG